MFARFDTNKDGAITQAEFAAAAAQMHAHMEQAAMHPGFGEKMFATADANKDGKVSLAEAQQMALQHFDRADVNHDGKLTPDERKQARPHKGQPKA
jgi:Ca2+-binding EF-hand superfamily protein